MLTNAHWSAHNGKST